MKNKKNILLFISFSIFIILISFYFSIVNIVRAEDIKFTPEVGIPTFKGEQTADGGLIGRFAKELYSYLMGLSGIVAVIILILAGFQWVTAGGNQNKIGEAKERIKNVITGLVLLGSSYLIMYTINPELVKIKVLEIHTLTPVDVNSAFGTFEVDKTMLSYLDQAKEFYNKAHGCSKDVDCAQYDIRASCLYGRCQFRSLEGYACDSPGDCFNEGLKCVMHRNSDGSADGNLKCRNIDCSGFNLHCSYVGDTNLLNARPGYCATTNPYHIVGIKTSESNLDTVDLSVRQCIACKYEGESCVYDEECLRSSGKCGLSDQTVGDSVEYSFGNNCHGPNGQKKCKNVVVQ
ncbi:MAG TPA: pilin [bacterium]|nr:pilin [bacterium]